MSIYLTPCYAFLRSLVSKLIWTSSCPRISGFLDSNDFCEKLVIYEIVYWLYLILLCELYLCSKKRTVYNMYELKFLILFIYIYICIYVYRIELLTTYRASSELSNPREPKLVKFFNSTLGNFIQIVLN